MTSSSRCGSLDRLLVALCTIACRPPVRSTACRDRARDRVASRRRRTADHDAAPPRATISSTTSTPFSRRLATTTCAPASPHASAMPRPTPAAPPVTITVRPDRSTALTAPSPIRRRRPRSRRSLRGDPDRRTLPPRRRRRRPSRRAPSAGGGRNDVAPAVAGASSSIGTSTVFTVMPTAPHWRAADFTIARTPSTAVTKGTSPGAPGMPAVGATTTTRPPCARAARGGRPAVQSARRAAPARQRGPTRRRRSRRAHRARRRPRRRTRTPRSRPLAAPSSAAWRSSRANADAPGGRPRDARRGGHRSMMRPPSAIIVWPVT